MIAIVMPEMIINNKKQSIAPPKYWNLPNKHRNILITEIEEFYAPLRSFYDNITITDILSTIQKRCIPIVDLSTDTSFVSTNKKTMNMLYEYYILQILSEYISQVVEYDEENYNDDKLQNKEQQQTIIKLIIAFLQIMQSAKNNVNYSIKSITDKVFKLKNAEKNNYTDKLGKLSNKERDVDTLLKQYKLGPWAKVSGIYNPNTFDKNLAVRQQISAIERVHGENPNINIDELLQEQNVDAEINNEELNEYINNNEDEDTEDMEFDNNEYDDVEGDEWDE